MKWEVEMDLKKPSNLQPHLLIDISIHLHDKSTSNKIEVYYGQNDVSI